MRRRPFFVAGATAVVLALVLPAGADALTLSTLPDGILRVTDPEGVRDDVTVRFGGTPLTDLSAPETDTIEFDVVSSTPVDNAAGCAVAAAGRLRCPRPSRFEIDLGGGDDSLRVDLAQRMASTGDRPYPPTIPIGPMTIRDGSGDDSLTLRTFADVTVAGGSGNDSLIADQAPSVHAIAGPGADQYESRDSLTFTSRLTVDYSAYTEPVSVTQREWESAAVVGDDGAVGEHDDVRSVYSVIGGAGDDRLQGARYAVGERLLSGGPGNDVLEGGGGSDVLDGGPGADRMSGGAFTDLVTYEGRSAPVSLTPDGKADDGERGEGDSIAADVEDLRGGAGDDVLASSASGNRLDGGPGTDAVSYASSALPVRVTLAPSGGKADDGAENEADDLVAIEHVKGGPFDDVLVGSPGVDVLEGGGGADVLDGGGGADELIGGPGTGDRADYSSRSRPVSVTIGAAADDGERGERDRVDLSIEEIVGGLAGDSLKGSASGDALSGGPGNDRIDGRGGDDSILGGAGADLLRGAGGADAFGTVDGVRDRLVCDRADFAAVDAADAARSCRERVVGVVPPGFTVRAAVLARNGTAKADSIRGTASRDRISGGRGDDRIHGRGGDDRLAGGTGTDRLFGDAGNDLLIGNEAPDFLYGGEGDDELRGLTGSDRLEGGPGDDVAEGGSGDDRFLGGPGRDRAVGGYGHDRLVGGRGDDDLSGDAAPDVLIGDDGNDALEGGSGDDGLFGGDGNDELIGGPGPDILVGGRGDDALYMNDDDVDERISCGPGDDTVYIDPGGTPNGFEDLLMLARLGGDCEHQIERAPGSDRKFDGPTILTADRGEARNGTERSDKLLGGPGPDVLQAGAGRDLLWGDRSPGPASPDVIRGGAGNDTMYGGGADDIVDGGAGDDMVQGDAGADRLFGGTGADVLRPAAGRDFVFGGPGDDTIRAEADKARDVIDCGPGRDIAYVDRIDRVRGCESVRYD